MFLLANPFWDLGIEYRVIGVDCAFNFSCKNFRQKGRCSVLGAFTLGTFPWSCCRSVFEEVTFLGNLDRAVNTSFPRPNGLPRGKQITELPFLTKPSRQLTIQE